MDQMSKEVKDNKLFKSQPHFGSFIYDYFTELLYIVAINVGTALAL